MGINYSFSFLFILIMYFVYDNNNNNNNNNNSYRNYCINVKMLFDHYFWESSYELYAL